MTQRRCDTCNGSGEVQNGVDFYWQPYWIACPDCGGSGLYMIKQSDMDRVSAALEAERKAKAQQ